MKVAVTGATGFVGRHLVATLEKKGYPTTLLVRSTSTVPAAWAGHNAVQADLLNPPDDIYDRAGKPEALIHLAWGGLPNYKSLHHFEQELPAQYRFLRNMLAAGLSNLVVVGTCFEYGMQFGSLNENMEARPNNPYGFAKDTLRRQLEYLQAQYSFALTWARMFYVYGEGQAENSLWPLLQRAVANNDTVFPMSGGEQLRDYLPITDVAKHLVKLAESQRNNGIVNICSGQPISVRKLVEGWIKQHGWSIALELGRYPYPDYEPMAFWGDRTKLDRCITPD